MQSLRAVREKGLSATAIKAVAALAMLADHIAWGWLPFESPAAVALHFIGRLAAPVMFYFLVEGYHNTKNANRYTLRLGLFAILSYIPFFCFEYGFLPNRWYFASFGAIYTLFLALLLVRCRNEQDVKILNGIIYAVLLLFSVWGDWPVFGVLFAWCFDAFRGDFKKQALSTGVVMLAQVGISALPGFGGALFAFTQLGQFLALGLLWLYNGQRGRGGRAGKWFFYIFYPAHLAVLALLRWGVMW